MRRPSPGPLPTRPDPDPKGTRPHVSPDAGPELHPDDDAPQRSGQAAVTPRTVILTLGASTGFALLIAGALLVTQWLAIEIPAP